MIARKLLPILIKIVVIFSTAVALFFFVFGGLLPVLSWTKYGALLPLRYKYFYGFPLLYWPYCLLSCTRVLKARVLLLSGVIMHLGLAFWIVAGGTSFVLEVGIFFAVLWLLLCVVRIAYEDDPLYSTK